MVRDSKESSNLLEAFSKGYRVIDNKVFSPKGKCLSLKLTGTKTKYYSFSIRNSNNECSPIMVHKLLAYQKFGDGVFEHETIRHLDGNSLNNTESNLALGTQLENILDIPLEKRRQKSSNANKKYNHAEIVKSYKDGYTYKDIMERFGISSKGTVSFIIKKSLESEKS